MAGAARVSGVQHHPELPAGDVAAASMELPRSRMTGGSAVQRQRRENLASQPFATASRAGLWQRNTRCLQTASQV
jgi:hypothetical protein